MEKLIRQFSGDPRFINMASYKDMVRVFSEQFVDNNGKAELNPHPGGKILLNPSDPEAEIGHKGSVIRSKLRKPVRIKMMSS